MKSILLSVRPEWAAKILNGEKTIEIRKKFPKDYVGWVYIYVAKGNELGKFGDGLYHCLTKNSTYANGCSWNLPTEYLNGKVVARFWCDKVEDVIHYNKENYFTEYSGSKVYGGWKDNHAELYNKSCLTLKDFIDYVGNKPAYAIHISKLEVFDRPKELWDFNLCEFKCKNCPYEECDFNCDYCDPLKLTKAPSNYCYIESEENKKQEDWFDTGEFVK